jgi:hypothetical protein
MRAPWRRGCRSPVPAGWRSQAVPTATRTASTERTVASRVPARRRRPTAVVRLGPALARWAPPRRPTRSRRRPAALRRASPRAAVVQGSRRHRMSPGSSRACRYRVSPAGCHRKAEGPSKYEFEGPSPGSVRPPPGFPGPARPVQTRSLTHRFRCVGDVVLASSHQSLRPVPPALGTLRTALAGPLRSVSLPGPTRLFRSGSEVLLAFT